tara:strand:+ start:46802 stop:47818 length:1017 start_codon:yes stop_codon:yes gene_type:complete
MKKQINEKTFELNITNELLNLSKSFMWYLKTSPLNYFFPEVFWEQFLYKQTFFAEGLTQAEESSGEGGYDVSISFPSADLSKSNRLMFLQYKAGIARTFCKHPETVFIKNPVDKEIGRHISFSFNDAANKTQHSILRNLAKRNDIQTESVMYVFPRITEKKDFNNTIGSLISRCSFVPVIELDNQAAAQNPPLVIENGNSHFYRTSYDGNRSEINYFYYYFYYKQDTFLYLLSELISIQIERLARAIHNIDSLVPLTFANLISDALGSFLVYYAESNKGSNYWIIKEEVEKYLNQFDFEAEVVSIPIAPEKYTTIINGRGINFKVDNKNDMNFQYQIF